MSLANLLTDTRPLRVLNAVAAGTSAQLSSAVDLGKDQGYDGVLFVALLGTVTSGSVLGLQAQDCATSGGSYANCGAALSFTDVGASSNGLLILDVLMPQLRFLKVNLTRTTQNAAIDGVLAIPYRAKGKPSTVDTSVVASLITEATS